jgi:hypothetical protein
MTSPDVKAPESHPTLTTHPLLGVAGVLLGAMIATCTGRLMSVGLVDGRGALHLGVDEASWINTSFNASRMFIGPLSVYLGGLLGPRRVLLTVRLFRGELGGVFMGHFIAVREEFHSNMLGLKVQLGNVLTDHRLFGLGHAFAPHSTGPTAVGRAAEVLGLQVRQQAFTLAISDSFFLVAACCIACLFVVAFMSTVPTRYRQVVAGPVEAK